MSVDMDIVGVMAVYLPDVRVCSALSREALDSTECTCTMGKYAAITPTTSMSMDAIEPSLYF